MAQMQPRPSTEWDQLIPTSFKSKAYIPPLKSSVTAGSFVRYKGTSTLGVEDDGSIESIRIGRIIDVVPSDEREELINAEAPPENEIPVQFV